MRRWRFALALLGLGGWVGLAQAQEVDGGPQQVVARYGKPSPAPGPGVETGEVPADDGPDGAPGHVKPGFHPIHNTLVGLGKWIGVPHLQSGYGVPGQVYYPYTQIAPARVTPPTNVGPSQYVPPNYPPLQAEPGNPRPVRNTLQRFGMGGWSHHNAIGCSSARSELTFIFGSCRAFFSEPLQHGPPPVPLPVGYPPGAPPSQTVSFDPVGPSLAPYGIIP